MMTLTKVVLATQQQLNSLQNLPVAIQIIIVYVALVAPIAPPVQRELQYLEENNQNEVESGHHTHTLQEVDHVTKSSNLMKVIEI